MPSKRHLENALKPYLEGGGPNSQGEWGMHCPLHDDRRRSASVNFDSGLWFCNACQVGGPVRDLIKQLERDGKAESSNGSRPAPQPVELPTEEDISYWHSYLMFHRELQRPLYQRRGLTRNTIRRWQIGYNPDPKVSAYTIPIWDHDGRVANVRHYVFDPPNGRRKIWSVTGHGTPMLYPLEILEDSEEIVVCEGEWDALLTLQKGFPAITRTSSAKTWDMYWNRLFRDKTVFVCHDMDRDGQAANQKVFNALAGVAAEVHMVRLPFDTTEDHGKDLTDYWMGGHNLGDFVEMLYQHSEELDLRDQPSPVSAVNVLNSFDARYVGQPLKMRVTITGKRTPSFLVPEEIHYTCTQDAGPKCNICPMRGYNGDHTATIEANDKLILEMIGSNAQQLQDLMRQYINAQKCTKLNIDVEEHRTVEELFVRPSVEMARVNYGEQSDFTHRKIISVGRHDSLPNNTVEMVGTVYPSPKSQHNEFQAWDIHKTETSLDKFEVTDSVRSYLELFQPRTGQRPLAKLAEISRDLAAHVTHIYGRNEMHALMDLVWHSAMAFNFGGDFIHRGWLEALVVGDTRTGKSEVAQKLIEHYGAGEYVSCESATFAGVVGGLQQLGSGREWEVTWGAIPINDRRLVVLDEVSGLSFDAIQSMSSIRSSGEAQLTKIRSERTWARTRLLWLGNPRESRMDQYTYGVQAIKPLIGNNEDIARFDLAMSLRSDDVASDVINKERTVRRSHIYTSHACEAAVLWAWSRSNEHITYTDPAIELTYRLAVELGNRYVEIPPLVQAANVRVKLARVATALAMRTVSTDPSYEQVIVKTEHVEDAVKFIDMLYGHKNFGYKESSAEAIRDLEDAVKNKEQCRKWLKQTPGIAKFLRQSNTFRRQDMEEMLDMSKEVASSKIGQLYKWRMLTREGQDIRISPVLHDILREVEE